MTERTKLLSVEQPRYVFESRIANERKIKLRQFQCCVCTIFLCIAIICTVLIVSYIINKENNPDNTTASFEALFALTWPLPDNISEAKYVNGSDWEEAFRKGVKRFEEFKKIEEQTGTVPLDTPSYRHQKIIYTTPYAYNMSKIGYLQECATKSLHKIKINRKICPQHTKNTFIPKFCNATNECNIFQRYRKYDGTCNNLKNPDKFGVAYTPFRRALPPQYADGVSEPRVAKSGFALPSAREVSLKVHRPFYRDDPKFTVMLAVWGQFIDHDMTATAPNRGPNGTTISCCTNRKSKHPECFPVVTNDTCMEFVRSARSPDCCLGPREQMNQVSSFIDGSVVYGTDEETVKKLRRFENGELRMYVTEDNRFLLPVSEDEFDGCNRDDRRKKGQYCFMTGDGRANENLHLTSMHLIWARQHNLLANNLSRANPHWDDERLFQETRKILAAQLQHITYNEFLPILIGSSFMKKFDLNPKNTGFYKSYDDKIDPSMANNFATSAFRFAHTLIPGLMKILANDTASPEFIQLHKMLMDPFALYLPGEMDRALRGAMHTPIQASDPYFTDELKEHLFERNSEKHCGLDLVSLNIQRGRDHGLPSYSSWREFCGLRTPRTFDDLSEDVHHDSLIDIKSVYREVEDIDLYTGSISEIPLNGSILGPTVTCLILDQFVRIKNGDRFWYENPSEFSLKQLNEIRKTTLAAVVCDNADNVDVTQPLVMRSEGKNNQNVHCTKIARPDLKPWKEGDLTRIPFTDHITILGAIQ